VQTFSKSQESIKLSDKWGVESICKHRIRCNVEDLQCRADDVIGWIIGVSAV
jgi:hypothetical protein